MFPAHSKQQQQQHSNTTQTGMDLLMTSPSSSSFFLGGAFVPFVAAVGLQKIRFVQKKKNGQWSETPFFCCLCDCVAHFVPLSRILFVVLCCVFHTSASFFLKPVCTKCRCPLLIGGRGKKILNSVVWACVVQVRLIPPPPPWRRQSFFFPLRLVQGTCPLCLSTTTCRFCFSCTLCVCVSRP